MASIELDPLANGLEQLSSQLGRLEGTPMPLQGGITNRNYRARLGGREVVVRLPGKDTGQLEIDRQAERSATECAARAGIAPRVAAMLERPPCLVTDFIEGEEMTPAQLREPAGLLAVGRALRRFHGCGEILSNSFSPFQICETYAARARERGGEV